MARLAKKSDETKTQLLKGLSALGRTWAMPILPEWTVKAFAQKLNLDESLARILVHRLEDLEDAPLFLEPSLKNHLPNPSNFKDMDRGVERVIKALENKENIVIYGDYDVDGATSTALLVRLLRSLGATVDFYIPDRLGEGYGPNAEAFKTLHAKGTTLVICVDAGTTAFEAMAAGTALGLDIIVIDHHVSEPHFPDVYALINPNRFDDDVPHKTLAAVGMCFIFAVGLMRGLRLKGFFKERAEPNLLEYLDLVALGTVCDVMPLKGLNRAFVTQGLKILAGRNNVGLQTLADHAGIHQKLDSHHLGFMLGPRINAGGRVGRSSLGAQLLTTHDADEARAIALELNVLNQDRQRIEEEILVHALDQIDENARGKPIIVHGEGWHPGVIGVVAGRLKERFNRPTIVIGVWEGEGKGSGRSVAGLSLGNLVIAAKQEGILKAGGGHDMAAGLTIDPGRIEEFKAFLDARVHLSDVPAEMHVDAVLAPSAITVKLSQQLEQFSPYGAGNAKPRFALLNVKKKYAELTPSGLIRVTIDCPKASGGSTRLAAVAFRAGGTPLETLLLDPAQTHISVVGTLQINPYNDTIQLIIEDAAGE